MQQIIEHFLLGLFFVFFADTIVKVVKAPDGKKLLSLLASIVVFFICVLLGYGIKLVSSLF